MKKLIYFLISVSASLALAGCISNTKAGTYIAGYDITPWLEYDGGYACTGIYDNGMNIKTINENCGTDQVEDLILKTDLCNSNEKVVWQASDFENQENIYFVALSADETAPIEIRDFYLLYFDDFSKAIAIFDGQLDEYYYFVENSDNIKQFFTDNAVIQ